MIQKTVDVPINGKRVIQFILVIIQIFYNNLLKWFYLSPDKDAVHTGIDRSRQEIVKYYGPFYNVGGGDVKTGEVYVIFYRLKK